jgi:hypothetical protein
MNVLCYPFCLFPNRIKLKLQAPFHRANQCVGLVRPQLSSTGRGLAKPQVEHDARRNRQQTAGAKYGNGGDRYTVILPHKKLFFLLEHSREPRKGIVRSITMFRVDSHFPVSCIG